MAMQKWWKKTLGNLCKDDLSNKIIAKKVVFFNLCGYHSEEYKQINKLKRKNK